MEYVRVYADEDGESHFEDARPEVTEQQIADGVPPLLITGPFAVSALTFVEQKPGPSWERHVAPRRQWVMCVRGRRAIAVSDGERREFGPGIPILVEDTTGVEHHVDAADRRLRLRDAPGNRLSPSSGRHTERSAFASPRHRAESPDA
jgi:hypothetical protein